MEKLAVIFPGMGYTKDRPLLYYTGKLLASHGYELCHIQFSGVDWSKESLKDQAFMEQMLVQCLQRTEEGLAKAGDLSAKELIFVSKSIGTVVAAAYAKEKGLRVRQICFSPLVMIDWYMEKSKNHAEKNNHLADQRVLLFYGDSDPLADYMEIERIANDKNLKNYRIRGGNHSLETGDILTDIRNLQEMMKQIEVQL